MVKRKNILIIAITLAILVFGLRACASAGSPAAMPQPIEEYGSTGTTGGAGGGGDYAANSKTVDQAAGIPADGSVQRASGEEAPGQPPSSDAVTGDQEQQDTQHLIIRTGNITVY